MCFMNSYSKFKRSVAATQLVPRPIIRKQESVSLATIKTTAIPATPELVLVPENTITPTRVVMRLPLVPITETSKLKPWDTYCEIKTDIKMVTGQTRAFHKLLGNFLATSCISSNFFRFEQLFAF